MPIFKFDGRKRVYQLRFYISEGQFTVSRCFGWKDISDDLIFDDSDLVRPFVTFYVHAKNRKEATHKAIDYMDDWKNGRCTLRNPLREEHHDSETAN